MIVSIGNDIEETSHIVVCATSFRLVAAGQPHFLEKQAISSYIPPNIEAQDHPYQVQEISFDGDAFLLSIDPRLMGPSGENGDISNVQWLEILFASVPVSSKRSYLEAFQPWY